jgi:5,6-dimethylbenzimidazole synthase
MSATPDRVAATERPRDLARYEALMDVVRTRMANRAFAPHEVPREHFELILEAARHAPSGANAQPWHYVVVTDQDHPAQGDEPGRDQGRLS